LAKLSLWSAIENLTIVKKVQLAVRIRTDPKNVAKGTTGDVYQSLGSMHVTHPTIDAAQLPILAKEIAKLLSGPYTQLAEPQPTLMLPAATEPVLPKVEIAFGAKLAIIKAYDLDGGRAHLSFQVHNLATTGISVTNALLSLNGVPLTPRQFFNNEGGVRVPAPTNAFPVIVAAGATALLNVEFENLNAGPGYAHGLAGTLRVEMAVESVEVHFVSQPEPRLVHALSQVQQFVDKRQSAVAIGIPIEVAPK
jgi:hypothetical protein